MKEKLEDIINSLLKIINLRIDVDQPFFNYFCLQPTILHYFIYILYFIIH